MMGRGVRATRRRQSRAGGVEYRGLEVLRDSAPPVESGRKSHTVVIDSEFRPAAGKRVPVNPPTDESADGQYPLPYPLGQLSRHRPRLWWRTFGRYH